LVDFDILNAEAVRSRKTLSNVWVRQRQCLGNSMIMFLIWLFFCSVFSGFTIYYGLRCGYYTCLIRNALPTYNLVNDVANGSLVIFGVSMLCLQKFFTASETLGITTELAVKVTVIATFFTFSELIMNTNVITSEDKIRKGTILATCALLVELFVTDYYMWVMKSSVRPKNTIIVHDAIDLDTILKNENLFKKFEKHLTQECSIENLNFLVSCIQYRRTVLFQGPIDSSIISDSEPEKFEELHWRNSVKPETLANRNSNIPKMARLIYKEFCQSGSPQWINMGKETSKILSSRIKNLSHNCDYPELNIFSEAFDRICDLLSNDSLRRFKMNLDKYSKYKSGGINGDYKELLVAEEY